MTAPVPSTSERSPATRNRTALVAVVVALVVGAGLAVAGSFRGAQVGGIPVFAIAVTAAFVIQFLVFIPSAVRRTERFFDLTGSLTFIAVSIALALLAPAQDARGWILAAMVVVWAARLGSFLFARVHRAGTDGRFDEIKTNPLRFFQVWCIQGLWVALTASAAWIAMSADAADRAPLDGFAVAGSSCGSPGWCSRSSPTCRSRLPRRPREQGRVHPHGPVVAVAPPQLLRRDPRVGRRLRRRRARAAGLAVGRRAVAAVRGAVADRVSGIPLLEKRADERWGDRADYRAYRDRTRC